MGGEKRKTGSVFPRQRGSPPRGRGKAESFQTLLIAVRITPAWAGKREVECPFCVTAQDHPRVGGEKSAEHDLNETRTGSPPRGRGKGGKDEKGEKKLRITPAWAGKSKKVNGTPNSYQDHPRVGGEKFQFRLECRLVRGSPPRGRGKVYDSVAKSYCYRITPAWAGKRQRS